MGNRQHRCPFYLLKITPKDLEIKNSNKSDTNNIFILKTNKFTLLTIPIFKSFLKK